MIRSLILAAACLGLAGPAPGGTYGDSLTRCFVSKTSAADQITLVRWIVLAFASHPAVGDAVTVDATAIGAIQQSMADYTQRIFFEDCLTEAREAAQYEGQGAVIDAFKIVSGIAGAQVTESPEVAVVMNGYLELVDPSRFERELFGR